MHRSAVAVTTEPRKQITCKWQFNLVFIQCLNRPGVHPCESIIFNFRRRITFSAKENFEVVQKLWFPIETQFSFPGKPQPRPVAPPGSLLESPTHKRSQHSDSLSQRSNSDSRPASSLSSPRTLRKTQGDKLCAKPPGAKDLRARYWAFLFENLRRAVDEIYQTCETDESVVECKVMLKISKYCL